MLYNSVSANSRTDNYSNPNPNSVSNVLNLIVRDSILLAELSAPYSLRHRTPLQLYRQYLTIYTSFLFYRQYTTTLVYVHITINLIIMA